MIITAWNNGSSGFGLRMSKKDRDLHISKEWNTVILHLEGSSIPVAANIKKDSFWNRCPEFINKEIKEWLINMNIIAWEKGNPPKLIMSHIHSNQFKVLKNV